MAVSRSVLKEPKPTTCGGALAGHRYRVIVSTDIGGTDPDDFQSMVHLLVYADVFDIEGLISSSGISGPGRKQDILDVIDCYEKDFANLRTYSKKYPIPDTLRALTKQGETEFVPYPGVQSPTEGSEWIVECARRDDPRPLYILGWGGIEDIAQALHDAPDILPKLRVYWVGGPNKKWGPHQYQYAVTNYPDLWIIEVNSTYRGWFVGGNQSGEWGNTEFVSQHIAGKGALGDFFHSKLGGTIKMGDTPSVGWLLWGTPEDPSQPRSRNFRASPNSPLRQRRSPRTRRTLRAGASSASSSRQISAAVSRAARASVRRPSSPRMPPWCIQETARTRRCARSSSCSTASMSRSETARASSKAAANQWARTRFVQTA